MLFSLHNNSYHVDSANNLTAILSLARDRESLSLSIALNLSLSRSHAPRLPLALSHSHKFLWFSLIRWIRFIDAWDTFEISMPKTIWMAKEFISMFCNYIYSHDSMNFSYDLHKIRNRSQNFFHYNVYLFWIFHHIWCSQSEWYYVENVVRNKLSK